MDQILGAMILTAGAFFGVWKGAVYAAHRLVAQLTEERERSDERLDAEARRLQMQLDAEGDRLQQQLDAEVVRLRMQLRHDREMRDLDELRGKIDELSVDMRRIGNLVIYLQAIVTLKPTDDQTWQALGRVRTSLIGEFDGFHQRLNDRVLGLYLRLLPDHPLVKASELVLDISPKIIALFRRAEVNLGEEERAEFFSLRDRLWDAQGEFAVASVALVGMLRLPASDVAASKPSAESA